MSYAAGQAGPYATAAQPTPRATIKAELLRLLPPRSADGEGFGRRSDRGSEELQDHMGSLPPGSSRTQPRPWASARQGSGAQGASSPRQQPRDRGSAVPGTADAAVPGQQARMRHVVPQSDTVTQPLCQSTQCLHLFGRA